MTNMNSNGIIWSVTNGYIMSTSITTSRFRDYIAGDGVANITTDGVDWRYAMTNSTFVKGRTTFEWKDTLLTSY